ncbi:unnamed protein product [Camellia sinensis]
MIKTGSGAGKDNISDAPNGSTHHKKSVVEKELSHSPSNLVFGYLNLFSDGVHNFTEALVVNTPIHMIMTWTMLILMFILDMSIHILLNMHFLERSFYRFACLGVSEMSSQGKVLDEGKTGSGAGKENISDAANGSTHHIKSVVEKELPHSPSNLVFGYLNLFSDGHNFTDGMALGSASSFMDQLAGGQELCFCLHMSFLKRGFRFTAGGFMYIAIVKVLAEINNGSSSIIKSIVLQLTSLISGMAVTLCISLAE